MSKDALSQYIAKVRIRYIKATKMQKTKILDEFCATSEFERKHAIKVLRGQRNLRTRRSGPKRRYDDECVKHLVILWKAMRRMCSKRMKVALGIWLDYYDDCDKSTKNLLLQISPSSIDRLLKPYRAEWRKGLSATKPGSFLKSQIPIEVLDAKVTAPGYVEADTVAHCGNSLQGEFASTLTVTDLLSGWTENRAMLTKTSDLVIDKVKDVRSALPFRMKGFSCDNGSEFINYSLVSYLKNRKHGYVKFTRRRPYKKNDAAHVEQKNDATVRQLFGYARIDDPELVALMNEIYSQYWNPLLNYFCPALKLKAKIRIGGRVKKIYDTPKTPYQRLIDSNQLTEMQKARLKTTFDGLNPLVLKLILDKKLELFFKKVRERSIENKQLNLIEGAG